MMNEETRKLLALWPHLDESQRIEAGENLRPYVIPTLVSGLGATEAHDVRWALQLVIAVCQAELEAETSTPIPPPPNRMERRHQKRRR